jgi:hypothetical protein
MLPAEAGPSQVPSSGSGQDAPPTPIFESTQVEADQLQLEGEEPERMDCPGVESQLSQILQAPDPLEIADQLGFRVQDGKIQVSLILADSDATFLADYDVEVTKQVEMDVQALVPVDRVCELATVEQVLAVRLPSIAVPQ